jgi:putative hydrolase of the HAD superfamily
VSRPAPVRAVLWDADGVLQRVPGGGEESMRPAVAGLVDDVEGFLEEAVLAERPALTGDASWPEVLPGLLERWGVGAALDHVLATWLSIEPVPAARALAAEVRGRGVACHLASNQAAQRAGVMRAQLGYDDLLDGVFFSCELGVAKPDPAYYEQVLRRLDLAPGQVLLLDDNRANVGSARAVGLRAEVWSYREPVEVLRRHLVRHGALAGAVGG